jgi:hypothetical protein
MAPLPFLVGFATGMLLTGRSVVLPLPIWHSGASMAAARVGVFAYRLLPVWLTAPSRWLSCRSCGNRAGEDLQPVSASFPPAHDGYRATMRWLCLEGSAG